MNAATTAGICAVVEEEEGVSGGGSEDGDSYTLLVLFVIPACRWSSAA